MKRLLLLLLTGCLLIQAPAQTDSLPAFFRDSLDGYVARGMSDWKIPGVAVCVVKNGKVMLMKGYGTREMNGVDKVDENTLFMIGSNTKAFTATALAMLDADKVLSLDDKVQKWLPDFKMYDPWVAREAIIRDLLCHRLGFETFQGDFMYFDSDLSTAEVREKMGKLKPKYGFRSRWGYTNSAFMTAGEIIPKATGKTWAEFVRDRIFTPLGMTRSLALSEEIDNATNKCSPHTVVHGELKQIPFGHLDNLAPAGSISSSVNDMSKWVLALLNGGTIEGKSVIPAGAIAQTRTPNSILGNGGHPFNRSHFALYGLGWFLEEYAGRKIVAHTGGVNGFVTSVCLVPEEKLGIVVFTNTDANGFYEALRNEIEDACLGLPYRNYSQLYLKQQKMQEAAREKTWAAQRDTVNMHLKTDLSLTDYAGTYVHPVYGKMTIMMEGGKLVARFEHHKGRYADLEPLGGSRFLATFNDPLYGVNVWPFVIAKKSVKSVTVTVADFVEFTPYEFTRMK